MIACFNYLLGLCPNRHAGATSDSSNANDLACFFPQNIAIQLVAKMPECTVKQNLFFYIANLVSGFRSKIRKTI